MKPFRLQTRSCPGNNILDCVVDSKALNDSNIVECESKLCKLNGSWTGWSSWSACEKKCGNESSRIDRYCYYNKGILFELTGAFYKIPCGGKHTLYRSCNHYSCSSFFIFQILISILSMSLIFIPFFIKYFRPLYKKLKILRAE